MEISSLLGLLAVLALVAANGFFVAAEFALVKVRLTRVEQLVEEGNGVAKLVRRQLSHLDNYIAATQLGITLASLALGWIGEPSLAHLIEGAYTAITGRPADVGLANSIAVAISFAIITGFHIVLGELVPKSIALQRSEGVALFVAAPLYIFARIFSPFIHLMNGVGNAIVRALGLHAANEESSVHSVEELEMLVAQTREAGLLDTQEEVLLRHVFDFGDKTAQGPMTQRGQIVALEVETPMDEAVALCLSSGYSRLPVYSETLDQVVGVLHAKDLLRAREETYGRVAAAAPGGARLVQRPPQAVSLRQVIRPATFVLEGQRLTDVLAIFRRESTHLALVVDEYGQVAGLLTLEDVLEELVGEIQDEYDEPEEAPFARREDGTWLVNGTEKYDRVREAVGLPQIPPAERTLYTTLAGLAMLRLGRIPTVGDRVQIDDLWEMEIVAMDGRRIEQVALRREERDEPPPEDE